MRKFLVVTLAVLGLLSFTDMASANCISVVPLPRPHCNAYMGAPRIAPGYPINRLRSVMPYAVRMPPGPIQPRVYYAPRVIGRTYGGLVQSGLVQTGYRVQAYSWQRYHVSTVQGGIRESLAHGGGIHQQIVNVPD